MSQTIIQEQLCCLRGLVVPDKRYGRPAYDGEPPSSAICQIQPNVGTFVADWKPAKELIGRRYDSAAPQTFATIGRFIDGSFSCTPTPQNIKLIENWATTMFLPVTLPWTNGVVSGEPDTDGQTASWTFDYEELPTLGQAERYYGVLFYEAAVSGSQEDNRLKIELSFLAQNRSRDFWTTPHDTMFTPDDVDGGPFLLKDAYIEIGDLQLQTDSFRVTISNPCVLDNFGEDGLARRFGMDSQQVSVEVTFLITEENHDEVDNWLTDSDHQADFRAMYVNASSTRRRIAVALNAGAGIVPLDPLYLASPATPKSDYTRLRGQDIVAIMGTQIDSPGNTTHIEVHKLDGTSVESPTCFWFKSEPSEGTARYAGLRKGFAAGAYVYSNATELVIPRVTAMEASRFADGPGRIRKMRIRFEGFGDGASSGEQLVDTFNPALQSAIRV